LKLQEEVDQWGNGRKGDLLYDLKVAGVHNKVHRAQCVIDFEDEIDLGLALDPYSLAHFWILHLEASPAGTDPLALP
jgi:hypothetical protein